MKITFTVILIVVSCGRVDAKGWRVIVPLHSDRAMHYGRRQFRPRA
jgi:hypothetical protein